MELGIDRSNLTLENEMVRQTTVEGIHALNAVWFRDAANASTATPKGLANLVDVLSRARAVNLKILLNIIQLDSDYEDGNVTAPRTTCGWRERKLTTVSLAKLTERLETLLGALRAANIKIDAFEIGNEDDTQCHNPDIPFGHYASDSELRVAVAGYARFLETVAVTIKRPKFYPEAKLITFGIAHGGERIGSPPHHLPRPARFLAMLRDVDGVNYLDNRRYHIDGIGTHIYANPNDITASVAERLNEDAAILGQQLPFWVTEWGFLKKTAFPNTQGQSIGQCVQTFLMALETLQKSMTLGPVFFYSYNDWLVDEAGQPTEAAQVLSQYAGNR